MAVKKPAKKTELAKGVRREKGSREERCAGLKIYDTSLSGDSLKGPQPWTAPRLGPFLFPRPLPSAWGA
jgi:hypothetical protein